MVNGLVLIDDNDDGCGREVFEEWEREWELEDDVDMVFVFVFLFSWVKEERERERRDGFGVKVGLGMSSYEVGFMGNGDNAAMMYGFRVVGSSQCTI